MASSPVVVSGAVPSSWQAASSTKPLTALTKARLLPAGPAYLSHVRRAHKKLSFEEDDKRAEEERARDASSSGANGAVEDDLGVGEESESEELLGLDPKEWKKQDHYQVLGLSHLRLNATQDQIKIAHRKKVLKHHPDKKAGSLGETNADGFFKCIQKAMEVLTHPEKRRQFDSVDPYYEALESDLPSAKALAKDPKVFFDGFGPVFEREARFSKVTPVPMLGTYDDGKEKVEGFYGFWYDFDSWRSFEYLDKEVNEGSDSRDDKRYTEKKNRSERARRKKEDIARVRDLVDRALAADPRIKRIKDEEKAARAAKKGGAGRSGASTPAMVDKAKIEEDKRKAEEEAKLKEEEDKVAREEAKKKKAAEANARKKARRQERAATEGTAA